jgi:hypothetical protein
MHAGVSWTIPVRSSGLRALGGGETLCRRWLVPQTPVESLRSTHHLHVCKLEHSDMLDHWLHRENEHFLLVVCKGAIMFRERALATLTSFARTHHR